MSHRKNLIVGLGVVLLTVLGSVSIAEAQGYPPPVLSAAASTPAAPRRLSRRAGLRLLGRRGGDPLDNCGDACGVAFSARVTSVE